MTQYGKMAQTFQDLKDRLVREFQRRDQNGSLANASTPLTPTPADLDYIFATQGQSVVNDALKIQDIEGYAFVESLDTLPDLTLLEDKIEQ